MFLLKILIHLKTNINILPKNKKIIFIVFGCGVIKGKLFNYLKKKNV